MPRHRHVITLLFCVRVNRHLVFHKAIQKLVRPAGVCTSHMTLVMKKKKRKKKHQQNLLALGCFLSIVPGFSL